MAATAATGAELPLDYLESKFASDSDDDTPAVTKVVEATPSSEAPVTPDPATTAEQPEDEQWDDEEDWTDSDDEDLVAALEWADSREGAHPAA